MTHQIQTARIAPVEPPYSPDVEEMLRKWMPPGTEVEPLALFRTLVVHESLAARMRPLGAGILGHGLLEPRDRELMIYRAELDDPSGHGAEPGTIVRVKPDPIVQCGAGALRRHTPCRRRLPGRARLAGGAPLPLA